MPIQQANPYSRHLQRVVLWLGVLIFCLGAVVMMGWVFEIDLLKRMVDGLPTMKFNTALCFLLGGSALTALQLGKAPAPILTVSTSRTLALSASLAMTVIALVTLSQYVWDWDSGLDQLFFTATVTDAAMPGRMSMTTSVLFTLTGLAQLLQFGTAPTLKAGQSVAAVSFTGSLLATLSYVYGAHLEAVTPFSSVAVHTAVAFLVLNAGTLAMQGMQGWVRDFFQTSPSARMGRQLVVATLVALPTIAMVLIYGQRELHLYDTYFGIAILNATSIAALTLFIWLATRLGNSTDRKLAKLARLNATLSGINTLIVRVHEQEELFREACMVAVERGHFPWVWIALVNPDSGHLTLQAQAGGNLQWANALEEVFRTNQQGGTAIGQAIEDKKPLILHSLQTLDDNPNAPLRAYRTLLSTHIKSLAVLPLIVDGKVLGAFALHAESTHFFDTEEMRLLLELAGDISFAINLISNEKKFNHLAYYDALTKLPNRTLFIERLGREMQAAQRNSEHVVLVLGDINRFHAINDSLGRHGGDELLCQFAQRLRESMKYPENLSRIDADCFASFITISDAKPTARMLNAVMGSATDAPFLIQGQDLTVEATGGVAVFPQDGTAPEILMKNAEIALKTAQRSKVSFAFYEEQMTQSVAEAVKLEHRLHRAVARGEFVLYYQPKVDFAQRTVHSVEALMRWERSEDGVVSPTKFIPMMEEIGLIEDVGSWALRQAVKDIGLWRTMGLQAPRVAVNVSVVQLQSRDFLRSITDALRGFGNTPALLDIEVTESMLMDNFAQTNLVLQAIRGMGVKISIDDFGTGHSSLAYLAELPLNALKIDRVFVNAMTKRGTGVAIVQAIISLARALSLEVIAEGVETEEQAKILQGMQCDLMQGYLFSKPVPFDQLAAMLPQADTV